MAVTRLRYPLTSYSTPYYKLTLFTLQTSAKALLDSALVKQSMEDMVFDTAELQTYLSEYERSGAIEFLKEQYIGDKGTRYNSV